MTWGKKWYIGRNPYSEPELFTSDDPAQATPEASGFKRVDGPYNDEDDACANMTKWGD